MGRLRSTLARPDATTYARAMPSRSLLFLPVPLLLAGCTPAETQAFTKAAAPVVCAAIVQVFDGPDIAAELCSDAAQIVAPMIDRMIRIHEKGAPSTCTWEPLRRAGGDPRERVCKEKRPLVEKALASAGT